MKVLKREERRGADPAPAFCITSPSVQDNHQKEEKKEAHSDPQGWEFGRRASDRCARYMSHVGNAKSIGKSLTSVWKGGILTSLVKIIRHVFFDNSYHAACNILKSFSAKTNEVLCIQDTFLCFLSWNFLWVMRAYLLVPLCSFLIAEMARLCVACNVGFGPQNASFCLPS